MENLWENRMEHGTETMHILVEHLTRIFPELFGLPFLFQIRDNVLVILLAENPAKIAPEPTAPAHSLSFDI